MKLTHRYVVFIFFSLLLTITVLMTGWLQVGLFKGVKDDVSKLINNHRMAGGRRQRLTAEEFRNQPGAKTGNPLIDDYGKNDLSRTGELGRGVTFPTGEKSKIQKIMETYRLNVNASDLIPVNRLVPDSRFPGCKNLRYPTDLPKASIIIPFHDEWPSVLLRTVYSIINRTPHHLIQEILLLDDASTLPDLQERLDDYISDHFPVDIVKLIRFKSRIGLIRTRQEGIKQATGDVIIVFDSHMEVNIDWIEPLLTEIKKDRKTVALGILDYIIAETLEYTWHENYITRYGFDWRLVFFETFFRPDQFGPNNETPKPGTVMVGAAFAIDRNYFLELGGYDVKMKVWGGENFEMAWKMWMCGGRLLHVPCSKFGHIARAQPYKFPEGRRQTEMFNYKRAMEVWMDPEYKAFVYDYFPEMKDLDVGDISERLAIKEKLQCKNFTWYLANVWPELIVYNRSVNAWGSAQNKATNRCLDNHLFLFTYPEPLYADPCHFKFAAQGFSWTTDGRLRTSLQCVVLKQTTENVRPQLEDCITGDRNQWTHVKGGHLKHVVSDLCMDMDSVGPIMKACRQDVNTQLWTFTHYNV